MGIENYKKITDLNQLQRVLPSDMFLVARSSIGPQGYVTYQTTFSALSDAMIDSCAFVVLTSTLLTSESQLNAGATTSAVAGNVGYILKTRIDSLSTDYIPFDNNLGTYSDVDTKLNFTQPLHVPNTQIVAGNELVAVNTKTLYDYIESKNIKYRPLFSTIFTGVKITDHLFILSDVLPYPYLSNKYTIIIKFKLVTTSNANYTVTEEVMNNGVKVSPEVIDGQPKLERKKDLDKTWYHVKYHITIAKDVDPDKVTYKFSNKNSNVDVMVAIFEGHI